MFAVVAMAFAACSSDDDQPAILQQLLGSWRPISNCSSCGQSRVYETWYKDLTWDKHETIDGKDQRIRKGALVSPKIAYICATLVPKDTM